MITNFKIFEQVNIDEPKVGDYVVIERNDDIFLDYREINNRIGKILRIRKYYDEVDVDYGKEIGSHHGMSCKYIKYWSKDKSDLEAILAQQKYNL